MAQTRTPFYLLILLLLLAGFVIYVAATDMPAPSQAVQMELPRETFLPAE